MIRRRNRFESPPRLARSGIRKNSEPERHLRNSCEFRYVNRHRLSVRAVCVPISAARSTLSIAYMLKVFERSSQWKKL